LWFPFGAEKAGWLILVGRCAAATRALSEDQGNFLMAFDTSAHLPFRPMLLLSGAGALLVAGAGGLWAWYGTTVFFEIVRAGWSACF
jgi:hypothetical protein